MYLKHIGTTMNKLFRVMNNDCDLPHIKHPLIK